ncbi:MAG: hypothetical protein NVS4B12_28070 [Ktedonobacteraceae bacterium]
MSAENETTLQTLHKNLIDQVKARGHISSRHVEAALRAVPRHLFLPDLPPEEVYQDKAIITKSVDGRFVSSSSQPTIMAIMLEQLDLHEGQRVLEIGAGTGYNAALMAHIVGEAGHIVTIDIDEDLVEGARKNLATAGFERVQVVCADGGLGFPDVAPYDRIILTVNAGDITPAWHEQLAPQGRILLPLGVRGPQISVAFKRVREHFESVSVQPCGFVGLRGAFAEQNVQVQLGPEPGLLYLLLGEPQPVSPETVMQWLHGSAQDIPTQIQTTMQEVFASLNFWLALHEAHFCTLTVQRAAVERGVIPNLFPLLTTIPTYTAIGLLSQHAVSVLKYAEDEPIQLSAQTAGGMLPPLPPVHLVVRTFGNDDELAHALVSQVEMWNTAGRPNEQKLHIHAYMHEQTFVPTTHDIVLKKQWTQFVFRW